MSLFVSSCLKFEIWMFSNRTLVSVCLSYACSPQPVYRWLRILSRWERCAVPVWGHQSLRHHQAADQWVVRSGSMVPPLGGHSTFKGRQRVGLSLASLGHPGQQRIWKTCFGRGEIFSSRPLKGNKDLWGCLLNSRHKHCARILFAQFTVSINLWFVKWRRASVMNWLSSPPPFLRLWVLQPKMWRWRCRETLCALQLWRPVY